MTNESSVSLALEVQVERNQHTVEQQCFLPRVMCTGSWHTGNVTKGDSYGAWDSQIRAIAVEHGTAK